MADITTTFAGIKLENPIIAASSGFTSSPDRCKKLQDAGVSAVVLKSIFEEQISEKTKAMHGDSTGEGVDMLREYVRGNELNNYITLVENTKKLCSIPVIASICCSQIGEWSSFAKIIEDAGADAIELNIMSLVASKDYKFGEYEERHAEGRSCGRGTRAYASRGYGRMRGVGWKASEKGMSYVSEESQRDRSGI